jgi:hypothetical protein
MDNRQTRYETIEEHLRHAMQDAHQLGDGFLAYLVEIALLETCMKTVQEPEKRGETTAHGNY